jgi:hypothetical protein
LLERFLPNRSVAAGLLAAKPAAVSAGALSQLSFKFGAARLLNG